MTNERILVSRNKREGYYAGKIVGQLNPKTSRLVHSRVSKGLAIIALQRRYRQQWNKANIAASAT